MTNQERARDLAEAILVPQEKELQYAAARICIERALDEAERRGQKEMREISRKACEWLPMTDCMDPLHDSRYCKTCEIGHDAADLLQGKIRALPIPVYEKGLTNEWGVR